MTTCPQCGAPVSPQHRFCEQCGANLRWVATPCVVCNARQIGVNGRCLRCGHLQPVDRDRVELTVEHAGIGLAAGISDRGHRRQRNEDAMACEHTAHGGAPAVLAVVCDGVASVRRGDEAAQTAARVAGEALLAAVGEGIDPRQATVDSARLAAAAVAELAYPPDGATGPTNSGGAPSTTYVSAVVTGRHVVVGWVGDSRAYWLGERPCVLTVDHALGGVLTRWVGADAGEVYPQVSVFEPDGPGLVVVCSDGLWNYLPEPDELAEVALPAAGAYAVADALTRHALDAGGRDNVTVVVVPFPPGEPA